ncbi:MAG: TetR/AcrR family transcriptional regulator [Brevinematales bacterium]|nr:TetR/AcrR family transcriptional regulator [Brevinematales bacterium]
MESPKDKIMNCAISLFSTKGFDATSVDEIAKESGVNKAMIYYYFSSKEGLLNSIIRKGVNEFNELFEKIDISNFSSPKEFVSEIVRTAIKHLNRHISMAKVFFREGLIYKDVIGTTITETISLVLDKFISKMREKFNIPDYISFVDQVIITNLVVGVIDLRTRISEQNQEEFEASEEQYCDKVSEIIYFLLMPREAL